MTKWRSSPRQVALALDLARDRWAPETVLAAVQRAWPEVVGPAIAEEAKVASERGGVLTVSCSASVWAQELDLMAISILERLNAALPAARITRLRCLAVPVSDERFR